MSTQKFLPSQKQETKKPKGGANALLFDFFTAQTMLTLNEQARQARLDNPRIAGLLENTAETLREHLIARFADQNNLDQTQNHTSSQVEVSDPPNPSPTDSSQNPNCSPAREPIVIEGQFEVIADLPAMPSHKSLLIPTAKWLIHQIGKVRRRSNHDR